MPPWEVEGEELTPWGRYVWRVRRDLYTSELVAKRTRERDELEMRING